MKTFIGFAGFGGVEIAMRDAGHNATSVELDPAIARVNSDNGGDVAIADILQISSNVGGFDLMHFSPPCPNFSIAKKGGEETDLDIALSRKISDFVTTNRPRYVSIENVWTYRKSQSWAIIQSDILGAGYSLDWWHLNSADYGVPQTRRRMIAIARRDGQRPQRPWPTHSKNGDMFTKRWVGWYEAIEDLIPGLRDTELAPWQKKRTNNSYFAPHSGLGGLPVSHNLPSYTITTQSSNKVRAVHINNNTGDTNTNRLQTRQGDNPSYTVVSSIGAKGAMPRAVLVDNQNGSTNTDGTRNLTKRRESLPSFTIMASQKRRPLKAVTSTRTVLMSPRCLARFQSFPDSFTLPDKNALACRGIGNALPPLMYSAVLRSLTDD